MFDKLANYKSISWDFDGVLIGHPQSADFWRYIRINPRDQKHHIVTMRSHGMQHVIFDDLDDAESGLDRMHFDRIINLPDRVYESFRDHSSDDHPIHLFKAEQCREIGAEVLVDDMEGNELPRHGCAAYGIVLLHPDEL